MRYTLLILSFLLFVPFAAAAEDDADYALEPVADGLLRFTAGPYHALVWVTDEGILLVDPLSDDAARWLKAELAERFDVPLRFVVYSHNHHDHAYGGAVFDDPGVTFIAHEWARDDLARSRARTTLPQVTFTDELAIRLGGSTLRLRHHGPNNGRGSVSMHFEDAGVMFVVDWIVIGRMPWKDLQGYDIEGMIRSTREVLNLRWETFAGGHAEIGGRAEVERYLAYLEALYAAVRDGMLAGQSLESMQQTIRLDDFADFKQYEAWLPLNIAGVYNTLADRSYLNMRPEVQEAAGAAEVAEP